VISMKIGKPKRKKPSREAIAAAPRIRNTKAELLDAITAKHKSLTIVEETIVHLTRTMGRISDADALRIARLKIIIALRRQLEKRLWDGVLELLAYDEREKKRGHGYTRAEMAPILNLRAMFE
jgi:hypothetical protein